MQVIFHEAQLQEDGTMIVRLIADGHEWRETMDRPRWDAFVAALDEPPLVLGGADVRFRGTGAAKARAGVIDYLRRVDYALRTTGRTDFIPGELPTK